jgi:chromosome segregation ATPase
MDRQQRIAEIQRLERALAGSEGADDARDVGERAAHVDTQIARLETAAISVERRWLSLQGDRDLSASEQLLFEEERDELERRLHALRAKIEQLSALRPDPALSTALARPPGVTAELRRALRAFVGELHADPQIPKRDIVPFQQRLAELVRERRDALRQVGARLADARTYLVAAATQTAKAAEIAAGLSTVEDAAGGSLPLRDERSALSTQFEMARMAVSDAHGQMTALANDWPELAPLARQSDWQKLPFSGLRRLVLPPEERRGDPVPDPVAWVQRALAEAHQTARATALWVDELRRTVEAAPPP